MRKQPEWLLDGSTWLPVSTVGLGSQVGMEHDGACKEAGRPQLKRLGLLCDSTSEAKHRIFGIQVPSIALGQGTRWQTK